mmetsp:Transcript_75203/g.218365  ORF Transcript_75203/g.218365 Transcript_75203/m.218365 type:complete len:314 (-) Transcript_75203:122-1063(-)
MVRIVVDEIAIQRLAVVRAGRDALQQRLLLLILGEQGHCIEELLVRLPEDVEHVREELPDAELLRTPIARTLQGDHLQLLPGIVAHHLADLLGQVGVVPRPNGQAIACLVRHRGTLDLELIMADVAVVVLRLWREQLIRQQRQAGRAGGNDVVVGNRRTVRLARRHGDLVGRSRHLTCERHCRNAQGRPKLGQPRLPPGEVTVLVAVVPNAPLQKSLPAELPQAHIVTRGRNTELGVRRVTEPEHRKLHTAQPRHRQIVRLHLHPGALAILRVLSEAAGRYHQDQHLLAREVVELEVVHGAHRALETASADVL